MWRGPRGVSGGSGPPVKLCCGNAGTFVGYDPGQLFLVGQVVGMDKRHMVEPATTGPLMLVPRLMEVS